MAKVDRSILAANDQKIGEFGNPDKLESSIVHLADTIDGNDTDITVLKTDNSSNKGRLNNLEGDVSTLKTDNTSNKSKITENEKNIAYADARVTNLLRNNLQPSEVVDARLGFPVLRDKLESVDAQLAENVKKQYVSPIPYGYVGDGVTDDYQAFMDCMNANPGAVIQLPPRTILGTTKPITISKDISLQMHDSGIKALAPMDFVVDYQTDRTIVEIDDLSKNKFIRGGFIDGNGLATDILRLNKFWHFGLDIVLYNPKVNGLIVGELNKPSAELFAEKIYVIDKLKSPQETTGVINLSANNIFKNVVTIDVTTGIYDQSNGVWLNCHPWIKSNVKVPNSKAFRVNCDNALFIEPEVDTQQYGFYVDRGLCRVIGMKSYWNDKVYTASTVASYPIIAFKKLDGTFDVRGAIINAGTVTTMKVTDPADNRAIDVYEGIYAFGNNTEAQYDSIKDKPFTPNIIGNTVAGSPTYARRIGRYTKLKNVLHFTITIHATLDSLVDGALMVSGLPFASTSNGGAVAVGYYSGIPFPIHAFFVTGDSKIQVSKMGTWGSDYINANTLRGTAIQITLTGSYFINQ